MDSEAGKEQSSRHRDRFIVKLFGKENKGDKKATTADDVDAFLHGSSTPPDPRSTGHQPVLTKIDTTKASRWPTATVVNAASRNRGHSASPKRSRKYGLVVHFSNEEPEIIGEGGDEAESPTTLISVRRRARTHPPDARNAPQVLPKEYNSDYGYGMSKKYGDGPRSSGDFQATVSQHQQLGHESVARNYESLAPSIRDAGDRATNDAPPRHHVSHRRPGTNEVRRRMSVLEGRTLRRAVSGQLPVSDDEDAPLQGSPESKESNGIVGPQLEAMKISHARKAQHSPVPSKYTGNNPEAQSDEEECARVEQSPDSTWSSTLESARGSPQSSSRPIQGKSTDATYNQPPSASRSAAESTGATVHSPKPLPRSADMKIKDADSNISMVSRAATINSTIPASLQAMSKPGPNAASNRPPVASRAVTDSLLGFEDAPQPPSGSTASRLQDAPQDALLDTPPSKSRSASSRFPDLALAVGDEALREFSSRVSHLFTLFRLSAESKRPLCTCSLEELVRNALWWFVKGRSDLEVTIRERPSTSEAQQARYSHRQQAYADLAKSFWIMQVIDDQYPNMANGMQADFDPQTSDILDTRRLIMSNLRKLTMSMSRNKILPPGSDAPLQTGLDTSIWVQTGGNQSLLQMQRPSSSISLSDTFPLGDTSSQFIYGRMFVDGFLIDDGGGQSENYRCPCLVSVVRALKDKALKLLVANQDTSLKMCVQNDKGLGPIWEEVGWRTKQEALDIKLPRQFKLQLQFAKKDFSKLLGIYDYHKKSHMNLVQRQDEELIFEKIVKSFQYFDQDPHSQTFPKEAMPYCQVRFFEKFHEQKANSGTRRIHSGFRVALVTGTKTKELRGFAQELLPVLPLQLGVLRGEGGFPALLVKLDDGKSKFAMAYTFEDTTERAYLRSLLVGSAIGKDESMIAEVRVKAVVVERNECNPQFKNLASLSWHSLKVINENGEDVQALKTVLSDHLRVIMDFKAGILTDRINAGAGELKLRLSVLIPNELKLLRSNQHDMTMSLFDSQAQNELPAELVQVLDTVANSETVRTYIFPGLQELHLFQAALTGFIVLYDGIASSFNISRRRMVVPIYKKWEAAATRLQIVQKEGAMQLLVFFDNFTRGDCMNFALRGTDKIETSTRGGKNLLRIVDAKFPMPRSKGDGSSGDDSGFVSLDLPEYPGEHDDITILFNTEADLESFAQAMPARTKIASRLGGSVRR